MKLHHIVDTILLNEKLLKSPKNVLKKLCKVIHLECSRSAPAKTSTSDDINSTALLKMKQKTRKPGPKHPCTKGRHNPLAEHPEHKCWMLHPHLRPSRDQPKSNLHKGSLKEPPESNNENPEACLNVQLYLSSSANSKKNLLPVLDSGSTHHMVNSDKFLFNVWPTTIRIGTRNSKNPLEATAVGEVKLINHMCQTLKLSKVLLVPNLNWSLISLDRLFSKRVSFSPFGFSGIEVKLDGFQLVGLSWNHLAKLCGTNFKQFGKTEAYHTNTNQTAMWHSRLGHPSDKVLKTIFLTISDIGTNCKICQTAKCTATPFAHHFKNVMKPLKAIHLDLVGPIQPATPSGFSFFLTIVDQYSNFVSVSLLKNKSNQSSHWLHFQSRTCDRRKHQNHHIRQRQRIRWQWTGNPSKESRYHAPLLTSTHSPAQWSGRANEQNPPWQNPMHSSSKSIFQAPVGRSSQHGGQPIQHNSVLLESRQNASRALDWCPSIQLPVSLTIWVQGFLLNSKSKPNLQTWSTRKNRLPARLCPQFF